MLGFDYPQVHQTNYKIATWRKIGKPYLMRGINAGGKNPKLWVEQLNA